MAIGLELNSASPRATACWAAVRLAPGQPENSSMPGLGAPWSVTSSPN
jgi:hypothetical protein